jgi:hypothetical protein
MNATDVEPRAPIGNEHVVRAARAEKLFASQKVADQHSACGWMEGHKARSTELGSSDREHGLLDIDIIELQIERFGNAQTRDAEQTQKAMKTQGRNGVDGHVVGSCSAASSKPRTSCSVYM